jgi:hypothetical protein
MLRKELSLGRVAKSIVFKDAQEKLNFKSEVKLKQMARNKATEPLLITTEEDLF